MEVDGDHEGFVVENNSVALSRGGSESVKIQLKEAESEDVRQAIPVSDTGIVMATPRGILEEAKEEPPIVDGRWSGFNDVDQETWTPSIYDQWRIVDKRSPEHPEPRELPNADAYLRLRENGDFALRGLDGKVLRGKFRLDQTGSPWKLDLTVNRSQGGERRKMVKAICQIDGDGKLSLCYSRDEENERPTSFDPKNTNHLCYSMVRDLRPSVHSWPNAPTSPPQLTTVEEAEARVRELIQQHKAIVNAEFEYTVWSGDDNGNTLPNRYHVWLNSQNGRRDHDEATEIQTEEYSFYRDANENRFGKGQQKFTRNTIPTLERMVGLYLPDAVVSTYDLQHHLLPENRKNITVELGKMDGQPVTIVKFDRELPHADKGWTQYVLSPAQGNCPIAITHNHSFQSGEKPSYSDSTQVSWRKCGETWFPKTIRNRLHSAVDARDERAEIQIERARFNADPFPDVFDPKKLSHSSRPRDRFNVPIAAAVFEPNGGNLFAGSEAQEPPQEVFERCNRMEEHEDWEGMLQCMTDDCRDEMVYELLFGVSLLQDFPSTVKRGHAAETNMFRAKRFMRDLKKKFPSIALMSEKPTPELAQAFESIVKRMTSVIPEERRQAKIETIRKTVGADSAKFFAALSGFMRGLKDEAAEFSGGSKLVDVDIQGDKAFAIIIDAESDERTPITFRKVDGQWKLDKLVSDSAFDHMMNMNQKVEDINAMLHASGEAETKEYFLELSQIPQEEQSIESAFRKHLERKTVSLFPDINETSPVIVLSEHSSNGQAMDSKDNRMKLAIFSDGHLITTSQNRVFSDQLPKEKVDALFELMKQQKFDQYKENPADLKMSMSELLRSKPLPLALKVMMPAAAEYRESIEISSTGQPILVIAPVKNKNIAYPSIKSGKERAFAIVRDRLLEHSNVAIAGGEEAVYAYRFIANEQLKKEHPATKPFDENDSLAAFLVKDENGDWQKRIEYIQHKRGETSVRTAVSINHRPDTQPTIEKIFRRGDE